MSDAKVAEVRGVRVPKLGFGTWQITGAECEKAVHHALALGYRHLDTARAYGNEAQVGAALERSIVRREQVFLTTKVWTDDFAPDRLRASAEASLRDLRTDYVDLLLLHWPEPSVPLEASLGALAGLREQGVIRELGVSNFPPGMLREALALAPVFCNQVEYHAFLGQEALLEICAEHDVLLTAYAPLAHGKALGDRTLRAIGAGHGRSAGQVALRWLLDQPRVSVIPKASSAEHREANFAALDFSLAPQERARIDALPKDQREFSPAWAPDWDA